MIESPSNARIKHVRALRRAEARRRHGRTFVEGARLVADALDQAQVRFVLAARESGPVIHDLAQRARASHVEVFQCSRRAFAAAADTEAPQGIIAVVDLPAPRPPPGVPLLLVIDGVQDPGNVGGMIRSAAAVGATGVQCTVGTADAFGPKAMRAGAGAQFRLPVASRLTPPDLRAASRDLAIYAAAPDGELPYVEVDWTRPSAVAVGAEARGVSDELVRAARATVRVPMPGGGHSLNAASAAAVILFEAARQRAAPGTAQGPPRARAD